jgi:hypothetical protein
VGKGGREEGRKVSKEEKNKQIESLTILKEGRKGEREGGRGGRGQFNSCE